MNKKISEVHQKRVALVHEGKKKESDDIGTWMIEEYFVPYQAS